MRIFFSSIRALDQYTFSLETLSQDDSCQYCLKSNQWVSHGYVYKQRSITKREVVGKRILCGNRYGKSGCGRTRQLYLQSIVPRRRYSMKTLSIFIALLCEGAGVVSAYLQATAGYLRDVRHVWRWVQDLYARVGPFRTIKHNHGSHTAEAHLRSKRLSILISTLKSVFPDKISLLNFQKTFQSTFF